MADFELARTVRLSWAPARRGAQSSHTRFPDKEQSNVTDQAW